MCSTGHCGVTSPIIRNCLRCRPATHRHCFLVLVYWVSNRNPQIPAGAWREGVEPDPPELLLASWGHWHQTGGPVAAAGIELLRALSLQIAAATCSYIHHSWLFLTKELSSHQSLTQLLSPRIFFPSGVEPCVCRVLALLVSYPFLC